MPHAQTRRPGFRLLSLAMGVLVTLVSCAAPELREGLGPDPREPVALIVTPSTATLPTGQNLRLYAYGEDANGDSLAVAADWAASGGNISQGGVFSASTSGRYVVRATAESNGDLTDSAVVTVTSAVVAVRLTPASTAVQPGTTQAFVAELVRGDNSTDPFTPTWSATGGTISAIGIYTAGATTGSFRVIATDPTSGFADTSSVTISATAPTLTAIEVTPAAVSLSSGSAQQFQAVGRRSDNSTTTVVVTWSATGGTITTGGRYTAGSTTGTFRVIATQQGGSFADTSTVTITAPVLTQVILTPASATLAPGATRQFSASGRLSNNATTSVSVNYSATGGTITTGGLYTAGTTPGSFRVIATQQGGTLADTSTVTVTAPPTLVRVVLSPTTAQVQPGGTQQFSAAGRMSDSSNSTIAVTYAATGGTITAGGLYTAGTTTGSFSVIATLQGGTLADTSAVTISDTPPPPTGGEANPLLLPLVTGNGTPPAAGSAPTVAVGAGYRDPLSNVQVWRVAGAGQHHDYSNGPTQISRRFADGHYTVAYGPGTIVDLVPGAGPRNSRGLSVRPQADLCTTFSYVRPEIVYVVSGGTLYRVNTTTNAREDGDGFPMAGMGSGACWLMNSADDQWFSTTSGGQARVYDVAQGVIRSTSKGGEAYLDRAGGRMLLTNEGGAGQPIWDVRAGTTTTVNLPSSHFVHGAALYGIMVTMNVDAGNGQMPIYVVDMAARSVISTGNYPGYSPDYHSAGQWVQPTAGLSQWILISPMKERFANPGPCRLALCFWQPNLRDGVRHIAYHWSSANSYWTEPHATVSPDGHLVMWATDGAGGGLFVAEVP